MTTTSSDPALLQRFIAGDQEAFAVLVSRYHGLVRATCARQADPGWDDDCVQAVFLVLSRRPAAALRAGNLPGWLVRVAWFVCRRSRRAAVRRQRAECGAAQLHAEAVAPLRGEPEALAHLDDCLQRLPSRQRMAVTLHYLIGHSAEEVAAQLGVTRDNAYQLLSRGLAGLRLLLTQRGTVLSATALTTLLTGQAQAATAAGAGSAGILPTLTVTPSSTATALAHGAMNAMTIATTAPFALAASLLLAVGVTTTVLTVEPPHSPRIPPTGTVQGEAPSRTGGATVETVGSGGQGDDGDWRRALEDRLEQRIAIDFQAKDLSEVVDYLRRVTEANIMLDPRAVTAKPPPITLTVADMRLRNVLGFITKLTSLRYVLRDEAIFITLADPLTTSFAGATRTDRGLHMERASKALQDSLEVRMTVDFRAKSISDVFAFLKQAFGRDMTVAPELAARGTAVTLMAREMKFKNVLRWLCELQEISISAEGDALFVHASPARAVRTEQPAHTTDDGSTGAKPGAAATEALAAAPGRPDDDAWRRNLEHLLDREVTLSFQGMNITKVAGMLQQLSDANIVLDSRVRSADLPPVTLDVRRMQLRSALDLIVKQTSLRYELCDEAIFITMAEPSRPVAP